MELYSKKKERKKIKKARLLKRAKGAISILLCLLLTPFLSIALGLVEYARYQEVIELVDEIYELTGVSTLSDYDEYIHNRFGLLATSQDGSVMDDTEALLAENMKLLGKQADVENPLVFGMMPLTNTQVLRQQVVDFSELTSTTAVIAEDFKVEELLQKLQGVSQFNDIMNTVDSLADLTDALTTAVEELENLKTALNNLQSAINSEVTSANTLASDMADLYKKLGENGITLPQEASLEEIENTVTSFCNDYLEDFKDLYVTGNTLVTQLNSIKTNLENVKTSADKFIAAVQNAREALGNVSASNSVDEDGSITNSATGTLEDVLKNMEAFVTETLSELKEETIEIAKQTVSNIIDVTLEETGLAGISERYSQIVNGQYFSLPLTDVAKQDIVDLLQTVQEVYTSQSTDSLNVYFKGKLVPNINIDVDTIISGVESVLSDAKASLTDNTEDSLISLLTKLVNIVKGLFDLDLFYEGDFNAFVNMGNAASSPYQDFLDQVGNLFTAVEDFKDSLTGIDLFGMLDALGDMLSSIWNLLKAIVDIAGAAIQSIAELGNSIITGDTRRLYEKLLISGYMRHNLPCRLDAGIYEYDAERNISMLSIKGKGLTGMEYNDIARPAVYVGQASELNAEGGKTKFEALATMLDNLKNGNGTDTMFKGAELEYIRAGTKSELANQVIVFFDLYFLRLILDVPSIFMDGDVSTVAASATVASWVVYIFYILAEPLCDTLLLVNEVDVPLVRTDCWLTATGLPDFFSKISDAVLGPELKRELEGYAGEYMQGSGESTGIAGATEIDYRTHVLLLLFIYVDSDTQIARLQDLIELETKEYYQQQGKTFSMSQTFTVIESSANIKFNPFFDLGIYNGGASLIPSKRIINGVSY